MEKYSYNNLRKAARISGTFLALLILVLAILELIDNWGKEGTGLSNYLVFLGLSAGVGAAGLLLALKNEFWGGAVSLLSFIAFNILAAMNPLPGAGYPYFLLLTIVPSILYLRWWWLERKSTNTVAGS
jgi:hypothetical protein